MDVGFLSTFFAAFVTLFIVIDPIMVAPLFAALTHSATGKERRGIAIRAALIAGAVLLLFGLFGAPTLQHLGIQMAAFRTAGGLLLFLMGFRMFFDPDGEAEAKRPGPKASARDNIAFFPIALPMLAGPGAIATIMLLMAPDESVQGTDRLLTQAAVLGAMVTTLVIGVIVMIFSSAIAKTLGRTGMNAIARLLGMFLMALATQYIFDGIRIGILEQVGQG